MLDNSFTFYTRCWWWRERYRIRLNQWRVEYWGHKFCWNGQNDGCQWSRGPSNTPHEDLTCAGLLVVKTTIHGFDIKKNSTMGQWIILGTKVILKWSFIRLSHLLIWRTIKTKTYFCSRKSKNTRGISFIVRTRCSSSYFLCTELDLSVSSCGWECA